MENTGGRCWREDDDAEAADTTEADADNNGGDEDAPKARVVTRTLGTKEEEEGNDQATPTPTTSTGNTIFLRSRGFITIFDERVEVRLLCRTCTKDGWI